MLKEASAGKRSFAIVRIDLDHFKDINDTYGQSTGDIVLAQLATKLQATYDGDFLARRAAMNSPGSRSSRPGRGPSKIVLRVGGRAGQFI